MQKRVWGIVAVVGLAAFGCKGAGADPKKDDATSPPKSPEATTAGATTAAALTQPGNGPAPRSKVPTLDEWNAEKKEVSVKGSTALGCETKLVREYLRVSCRGQNNTGGKPTTVKVLKGGREEALTFAASGVTSLVVPFLEGINLEVEFGWSDGNHKLTLAWPRGSNMPTVLGSFEGASSPLGAKPGEILCKCLNDMDGKTDCTGWQAPACEKKWLGNCAMMIACANGDPTAKP